MNDPQNSPPPTRVRYSILMLLCLLAMITYMDRAMYGSAKEELMTAVNRPVSDFYIILVVFQLAYALFEIPTGWMGDTYGPRATLLRIVLWWSLFVGLTGFAGMAIPGTEIIIIGFVVLVIMQFLFGVGEAGAFPNISRAVYNWFPNSERGFAQGTIWLSARFMGGLTPMIWVLLVTIGGLEWRQVLWLFAGIAFLWCLIFAYWFRNRPDEHSSVNTAEATIINAGKAKPTGHGGVPWKKIFSSRNVWGLCLMYMVTNYNWYFLMYYLPGTFRNQFDPTMANAMLGSSALYTTDFAPTNGDKILLAFLGGAPLLIGMFGCLLGGYLTDRYIRKTNDRRWGRRLFGMIGYGSAGFFYITSTAFMDNLWMFAFCLMMVGFCNDLIMGPAWATAQDIGRKYSAIISGTMNMVGNLGAVLGNLVTGWILAKFNVDGVVQPMGFTICFIMFGVVYGLGVVSWLLIDPTKPIDIEDDQPTTAKEG